jgi:hypothetical protein
MDVTWTKLCFSEAFRAYWNFQLVMKPEISAIIGIIWARTPLSLQHLCQFRSQGKSKGSYEGASPNHVH